MRRFFFGLLVCMLPAWADVMPADSARGAQLFQSLQCVQCHSVNGQGAKIGPDLGKIMDRNFTPPSLAATMWNHAPTMWQSMRQQNIHAGELSPQAAADLFAFFYSRRFFDKLGDAGRGKRAFSSKHCDECHGLTQAKLPAAKPVAEWAAMDHPIAFVDQMWNHAATMRQEFESKGITWPELTSQDLTDILVYVRNLPAARQLTPGLEINAGTEGQSLFQSKGCTGCHSGDLALDTRLKGMTLTDIAVAMWNHAPKMAGKASTLNVEEMRSILSFLWARQFFQESGNASAGQKVFASRHCSNCHADSSSGAPKLAGSGKVFDGATMVSVLWSHGPGMMQQMQSKGISWPRFRSGEMSNLIAYLNSVK